MNIPKFNAFQKVILCLGALAVALRCFFPVEIYRESDFTSTIFHCIGIVIVTGVIVYIFSFRLKYILVGIIIISILVVGLILYDAHLKRQKEGIDPLLIEEAKRRGLISEEEARKLLLNAKTDEELHNMLDELEKENKK